VTKEIENREKKIESADQDRELSLDRCVTHMKSPSLDASEDQRRLSVVELLTMFDV